MSRPGAAALVPVLLCLASPAGADEDPPDPEDGPGETEEPRLITEADRPPAPGEPDADTPKDHHKQFGVGLQIPIGFRAIAPYDGEYCGARGENESENAEVCVGRNPASLDFELAYGIRPNLEILLEIRLGIERDFGETIAMDDDGPRLFHWSPGVKFYFSEARISKLFSTAQIAFDHTGYGGQPGTDFFLRNVNGLQFDLHPSYGLYLFVAEELAFRRWFWVGIEAGIGIQGRYP
jgi:hypothetical protein